MISSNGSQYMKEASREAGFVYLIRGGQYGKTLRPTYPKIAILCLEHYPDEYEIKKIPFEQYTGDWRSWRRSTKQLLAMLRELKEYDDQDAAGVSSAQSGMIQSGTHSDASAGTGAEVQTIAGNQCRDGGAGS